MICKSLKIPFILSVLVIILSVITSAGGLLMENLYRDNEVVRTMWFVNDIVTLLLAVPSLAAAMVLARKGSLKARLIWAAVLWYMIYNYVFYAYGAVFNSFFLFYVALIILPAYSVILILASVDSKEISKSFREQTPNKLISIFMLFFGTALGTPWIALALRFILSGQDAGDANRIVIATDWIFLISIVFVSGILLWNNRPWGYILTMLIMIKTLFYPFVLVLGGIFTYTKTGVWDSFIPLYAVLWAVCTGVFITLLRNMKPS